VRTELLKALGNAFGIKDGIAVANGKTTFADKLSDHSSAAEIHKAQKLGGEKFDADEDNNQFKMDLARDLVVFVPDGDGKKQLPKKYGEARDDLLKFVTGNAAATWQNASKADKTKVAIMMACVNQGTYAVVQLAMLDAIDETRQSALSPFDFMNVLKLLHNGRERKDHCKFCAYRRDHKPADMPSRMNSGRFAWIMPLRCWMGSLRVRMYLG